MEDQVAEAKLTALLNEADSSGSEFDEKKQASSTEEDTDTEGDVDEEGEEKNTKTRGKKQGKKQKKENKGRLARDQIAAAASALSTSRSSSFVVANNG